MRFRDETKQISRAVSLYKFQELVPNKMQPPLRTSTKARSPHTLADTHLQLVRGVLHTPLRVSSVALPCPLPLPCPLSLCVCACVAACFISRTRRASQSSSKALHSSPTITCTRALHSSPTFLLNLRCPFCEVLPLNPPTFQLNLSRFMVGDLTLKPPPTHPTKSAQVELESGGSLKALGHAACK